MVTWIAIARIARADYPRAQEQQRADEVARPGIAHLVVESQSCSGCRDQPMYQSDAHHVPLAQPYTPKQTPL